MAEIHYWQAVRDALREEMIRDPRVFIIGEDVAIYGGAYGATRGLYEEFGAERVRDSAISEAAIAGAAVGAAMCGYRPVAEIMYMDFMTIAMDQFCNQGAKNRYMFGGKTCVPMVLRTEAGAGRSIAAQHSQSLEAWFMHVPGILIVCPSTPYDVKGLLKAAIRVERPGPLHRAQDALRHEGRGAGRRLRPAARPGGRSGAKGRQITVASYSRMALRCNAVCQKLAGQGVDAEMIDLRCLRPLDLRCHPPVGQEDRPAAPRLRGMRRQQRRQRDRHARHGARLRLPRRADRPPLRGERARPDEPASRRRRDPQRGGDREGDPLEIDVTDEQVAQLHGYPTIE